MPWCRREKWVNALVFALAVLAASPVAFAQSGDDEEGPPRVMNAHTAEIVIKASELVDTKNYAGARKVLGELSLSQLNPYERSRVELILANIDNIQENYATARRHLQQAMASGGLNAEETERVRINIARLFMIEENWAAAAALLEEWFRHAKNPDSIAYYLLAIAYYQLGDSARALAPAQKAVELMEKPQTAQMELLLALYLERKDYREAIELNARMVETWPRNESYWLRLSSLYQAVENYDRALATLQVAYNAGYFTQDSQTLRLAELLQFNHIPQRCARILEAALAGGAIEGTADSYEKLGNCWISAREFEKSIAPLRQAAELSDDGNLYVRLAEVQLQQGDWKGVASAVRNAIDKGDLDDSAHAQLMMGIALFKREELAQARKWFARAARDEDYRDNATAYINAINACAKDPEADWCG
ncbi:MAG: tetratricopeptide repeat protein [Nitrococcus sp.]|nr:tetratricopeptide repeat protein [Nitrococcus sp.]